MTAAIEAIDVSVTFDLPRIAPASFKEFAIRFAKRDLAHERMHALRGVSFAVERGELLGVVGPNGAGKTTLLKTLAGIVRPTEGRVVTRGRMTPVLGLGVGLQRDLTGRENIVLLGAMLGRDPRVLKARAPVIADWAGLAEYLEVPLRTYSLGMLARLAFAVVTDEDPDVLLLDEVLAVGDADFQRRSLERIDALLSRGTAAVLVSHALPEVAVRASRVMWLEHGRVVRTGEPEETIAAYAERVAAAQLPGPVGGATKNMQALQGP